MDKCHLLIMLNYSKWQKIINWHYKIFINLCSYNGLGDQLVTWSTKTWMEQYSVAFSIQWDYIDIIIKCREPAYIIIPLKLEQQCLCVAIMATLHCLLFFLCAYMFTNIVYKYPVFPNTSSPRSRQLLYSSIRWCDKCRKTYGMVSLSLSFSYAYKFTCFKHEMCLITYS